MADNPTDSGTPSGAEGGRRPRVRILLSFLGAFVLLLVVFRGVLFPFLMAIYIAYLIEPIVGRVVKSRLLGFKWTRGPTIVTLYVLILGGLSLLGWWGIATMAKQVRSTAASIEAAVQEQGYRATFELTPPPSKPGDEGGDDAADGDGDEEDSGERGILVPKDTRLHVVTTTKDARSGRMVTTRAEYATLYPIRVTPGERIVSVLLERANNDKAEVLSGSEARDAGPGATLLDIMGLRYAEEDAKISIADAERLRIQTTEAATGFEYFMEREFVSPIVENLAGAGYNVEPNLLRDYIAIQGEVVREDLPERIGKSALTFAGSLVFSVYEFFLILMLTAFIVMDRREIAAFFQSLPPPTHRSAYDRFVRYIDDGLAGVIRGQLVICGVNGLLTYFGLLILGVPYATMLSVMAAILSLIPVFGTIVSSIPIVLVATTRGVDIGLMALAWIGFIHILEANIFNPMIMGTHARMHPVVIIFALLAGEHSFGIWGALLAVPTMSLLQSSFRFYLHEIEGHPSDDDEEGDGHGGWISTLWHKVRGVFSKSKPVADEAS